MMAQQPRFVPIDAKAKRRKRIVVKRGDNLAVAYWSGGQWSYPGTCHQIDFEPTHYAVSA
jgi:hypothetical protein